MVVQKIFRLLFKMAGLEAKWWKPNILTLFHRQKEGEKCRRGTTKLVKKSQCVVGVRKNY